MNLRRIGHSIVTRILLLGIGIIIVGTVARYFLLADILRDDLQTVISAQQATLASYIAHDIDQKIRERRAMLDRLALALPRRMLQHPDDLGTWLGQQQRLQPWFSPGLQVVGRDGHSLSAYPWRLDQADRDYLQAGMSGKPSIGHPVMDPITQKPVLPMAVPIRNGADEVVAVLIGVTPLAPGLLDLLQEAHIGRTGEFRVVSPKDKLFLAANDAAMVFKPTPAPGVNRLHDRAMDGYRGSGITINENGSEELAAISSVPSTGWFVVAAMPTAEAFSLVTHTQQYILSHGWVVVLVFLSMTVGGLVTVFRPLFLAADHADKMTRGEIPLEPLPVARTDEVGHLTEAFNRLLAKLQLAQGELVRLAHQDPLTSLANRAVLSDRIQQALARASRHGTRLGVLFLDLDGFKPINDTLGHEAGDAALVEVSRRLSAIVRESDTLARVGGDEFVIVMCDLGAEPGRAEDAARMLAAKCIKTLETPLQLNGRELAVGLSIGIALGDARSAADGLLSAADCAMYEAKQAGRGRYMFANPTSSHIAGKALAV